MCCIVVVTNKKKKCLLDGVSCCDCHRWAQAHRPDAQFCTTLSIFFRFLCKLCPILFNSYQSFRPHCWKSCGPFWAGWPAEDGIRPAMPTIRIPSTSEKAFLSAPDCRACTCTIDFSMGQLSTLHCCHDLHFLGLHSPLPTTFDVNPYPRPQ